MGAAVNQTKSRLEQDIENRKMELGRANLETELSGAEPLDVTLPGQYAIEAGSFHPLSRVTDLMVGILRRVGFSIAIGPEAELEYYNFEALNTPEYHPARDEQDTFYFQKPVLLRSHTSPVQIRAMQAQGAPLRVIAPGRVFRCDSDMTHTPMFHQVEGLVVDKDVSFANLKSVIHEFVECFFERRVEMRFRPSYFPFTEPSAEMDILSESGKWLEIGGCGMVHPNVLRNVGIDPDEYSGYAFGMGVERMTMLRYGVNDLRLFFENDLQFLQQFV